MKKPVVIYSCSGVRSALALSLLQQYGISDIYNGGSIENMKALVTEYA